jgi:hypothetical protein
MSKQTKLISIAFTAGWFFREFNPDAATPLMIAGVLLAVSLVIPEVKKWRKKKS